MKELNIIKQKKNVKIFLKDSILTVQGPLGSLSQKLQITNVNDFLLIKYLNKI